MKKTKFNPRDVDFLQVLWNSDEPLAAGDILLIDPSFNKNTAQSVATKLLKKKAIKISSVGMRNKALVRLFKPTIDQEQFIFMQYPTLDMEKLLAICIKKEKDIAKLDKLLEIVKSQ